MPLLKKSKIIKLTPQNWIFVENLLNEFNKKPQFLHLHDDNDDESFFLSCLYVSK